MTNHTNLVLPEDVLRIVFDALAPYNTSFVQKSLQQTTLSYVSRTCRRWHTLAIPFLYAETTITNAKSLALLYRTLRRSFKLREYVKSFMYLPDLARRPDDVPSAAECKHMEMIHKFCYHLHLDFLARSFYMYIYVFGRHRRTKFFEASTHPVVTGLMQVSHLTRLELGTKDYRLYEILLPTLPLPNLQELHLAGFRVFDFHDGLASREMQWPAMPNLYRLRMTSCTFITACPLPKQSPNLKILEVDGGIIFATSRLFDAMAWYTPDLEYLSIIPRFSSVVANEALTIDLSRMEFLSTLRMSLGLFLPTCVHELPPSLQDLLLYEWQDGLAGDEYEMVKAQLDLFMYREHTLKSLCIVTPKLEKYEPWVNELRTSFEKKDIEFILRDIGAFVFLLLNAMG